MEAESIISVISSLATLCAAIIALFALFEMSRQRRASYKPELCLLTKKYKIKTYENPKVAFARIWFEGSSEIHNDINLNIVNIGLGAARDISIQWSANFDKLFSEIDARIRAECQPIKVIKFDFEEEIEVEEVGGGCLACYNSFANVLSFDHLLPMCTVDKGITIGIPDPYRFIIEAHCSMEIRNSYKEELSSNFDVLPEISLILKYKDIAGNKIQKVYTIKANILHLASYGKLKENRSGHIEIEFSSVS